MVILEAKAVEHSKSLITDRETEYLSLAAIGFKNFEIAGVLSVQECAVKKTLENIFRKLFAKDRTHAVTLAIIHQIITIDILYIMNKKAIEFFKNNPDFYKKREKSMKKATHNKN